MTHPLEISALSKIFETVTGPYLAVKDFSLQVREGEFVTLLGHSGCGKSTVLSILAGLQDATLGGVCIDGKEVKGPGTERGVVFQSPSLLPWLTARENVALAIQQTLPSLSRTKLKEEASNYLNLVGLTDVADQSPAELSLGTQQRVAIARALALQPRFLLLDEPFGMVDSLTRFELQDVLLRAWEHHRHIVVMVTHDVDEALYLSDRVLLMTDGPEATLGEILDVPFPRRRERLAVLQHNEYYASRRRIIDFLDHHARQRSAEASCAAPGPKELTFTGP